MTSSNLRLLSDASHAEYEKTGGALELSKLIQGPLPFSRALRCLSHPKSKTPLEEAVFYCVLFA